MSDTANAFAPGAYDRYVRHLVDVEGVTGKEAADFLAVVAAAKDESEETFDDFVAELERRIALVPVAEALNGVAEARARAVEAGRRLQRISTIRATGRTTVSPTTVQRLAADKAR